MKTKPLTAAQTEALRKLADGIDPRHGNFAGAEMGARNTLWALERRGLAVQRGAAWKITRAGRELVEQWREKASHGYRAPTGIGIARPAQKRPWFGVYRRA